MSDMNDRIIIGIDVLNKMLDERDEKISVLQRQLAAAVEGWRDIGTAPRDGTEILGVDDDGIRCVIRWSKHNHVPIFGWVRQIELYGEEVDAFDAVKWSPLPQPPKENT